MKLWFVSHIVEVERVTCKDYSLLGEVSIIRVVETVWQFVNLVLGGAKDRQYHLCSPSLAFSPALASLFYFSAHRP